MQRREFITLLGGAAAAWPLAARAQQAGMPVIGFLHAGAPEAQASVVAAFRKGLNETGFVEGRNVIIEYRWAYNEVGQLPELAADLVRRRVGVIVVPASTPAALAAKAASSTIPIVFGTGGDPVQTGLVASLSRPGGNVTGVNSMNTELNSKRLGLLKELLPEARRFALLHDPSSPFPSDVAELQRTVSASGRQIEIVGVSAIHDIDAAFARLAQRRVEALLITADPLFSNRMIRLPTSAAHFRLPAMYPWRESVQGGGLISYGSSLSDRDRLVGVYAGRILKGEKPADLPVMQPTRFELAINQHTASLLGIVVSPTLVAIADEVIE